MVLRELLVRLGIETQGIQRAETGLQRLVSGARQLAAATGLVIAARRVSAFVDQTTIAVDQLAKTSQKLGIGAQALGELRFAAERTGVSTRTLDLAMQRFIRRAAEASQGTGEAKKAFQELGISQKELANSSPEDLLARVADGLAAAGDSGTQLRLAFKFFDSEGAALVNTLKGGSKELGALRKRFRELGVDLSGETTQSMEEYRDVVLESETASQGLKIALSKFLLPLFTSMAKSATKTAQAINFLTKETKLLQATLALIGVVLAALAVKFAATAIASQVAAAGSFSAWVIALLPLVALLAVIGAVILIFEDLFVGIDGGNSVLFELGDTLSKLFDEFMSLEAANPILDNILSTFQTIVGTVVFLKDAIFGLVAAAFGGDLDQIGSALQESLEKNILGPAKRTFVGQGISAAVGFFRGDNGGIQPGNPELAAARQQFQASATRPSSAITDNRSTNSSQITVRVDGAGDPNEVARKVAETIQVNMAKDRADAQRALTPRFNRKL